MPKWPYLLGIIIGLGLQICRGEGLDLLPVENRNLQPIGGDVNSGRPPTADQIWKNGVGGGFVCGTREVDVSVVAAFGLDSLGIGANNHNLIFGAVQYGWVFDNVVFEDHWFRGNWEVIGEGFAGAQYHPKTKYVAGATPLIRYNFATGTRWMPILTCGAGVSVTDIGSPDLSTTFEFNIQAGAGVHYFLRDNAAITFEARYLHFSNAGLGQPNEGVNTISYQLGFSWFF